MKIEDGKSDAVELIRRIHREMKALQNSISELEYLIYEQDERCKIEFFGRGKNDTRGSQKRVKAD